MAPSSAVGPAGPGITCQVTRLGGMWGGEDRAFSPLSLSSLENRKGTSSGVGCWAEATVVGLWASTIHSNHILWINTRVVICSF